MTDEAKALVERLRDFVIAEDIDQAADLIETQAREIERLREALGWFLNDSRFVVQVGGNPNVVPQMIEAARAALAGDSHDQ